MARICLRLDRAIPSNGISGGLTLFWSKKLDLEVKSYTKNHTDAVVTEPENGFKWRVTGFYGHPDTHKRYESWNLLAFLHNQFQLPWLCFGDFNKILCMDEKFRRATQSQHQMSGFRNVVDYCGFQDLGYLRNDFTWSNMQEGDARICLRLDRALSTTDWITNFWVTKVHHLIDSTSDHCALLLANPLKIHQPQGKWFHFEAMWTKREDYKSVIEACWRMGSSLDTPKGMAQNLKVCTAELAT